jgi:hypothetical protein
LKPTLDIFHVKYGIKSSVATRRNIKLYAELAWQPRIVKKTELSATEARGFRQEAFFLSLHFNFSLCPMRGGVAFAGAFYALYGIGSKPE